MKRNTNKFKVTILVFLVLLLNTSISAQCYKSNLDVGKQQYNSGKYQTALATFEKSLKCPDAKAGAEAKQMIEKCKEKLNNKKAETSTRNNKEKEYKEQTEKELREKIEKELRVKIEQEMKEKAEKERINKIEQERKIAEQKNLKIGDNYAGGIIFYLDKTGNHGKVCAPFDQSDRATWNEAKRICSNLTLNGYSDWYLPNKNELYQIYENLHRKNKGGFARNYYWSSTEYYVDDAWGQYFGNGYQSYDSKYDTAYVRAIRAF